MQDGTGNTALHIVAGTLNGSDLPRLSVKNAVDESYASLPISGSNAYGPSAC